MIRALLLEKTDEAVTCSLTELTDDRLPDGDVTVDIEYSTLNYKDALAITDTSPVVRSWPMVPGVDFAGTVSASSDDSIAVGDRVVLNGWDVGEQRWGGLTTRTRIDGSLLVKLPDALSTREAMAIGTAGYTAMLCVLALEDHGVTPESGPVVVTGAAGGVGSVSVSLLSGLGYDVHAVTGRPDTQGDYLRGLGAVELIDRSTLEEPGRPLARAVWAGVIDAVGGQILANLLAQVQPRGCVVACGLAASMDLPTTVAPFILRGITLVGIDSVHETTARRELAYARLATDLDRSALASMTTEIGLGEVEAAAPRFLRGEVAGRIVVDVTR